MKDLHQEMKEYFMSKGFEEERYERVFSSTVNIASLVSIYAHRNQVRENGEGYYEHPYSCMELYRRFVGIVEGEYDCIDLDLLQARGIPFEGVQEVSLLHDVLEDTDVTLDELESLFKSYGYESYFNLYIKQPLLLITHDKSEGYDIYIERMLENPIACLCKMLDMTDNMNMLGLARLQDKELQRTIGYAKYVKQINDKWHFIENALLYKQEFANLRSKNKAV